MMMIAALVFPETTVSATEPVDDPQAPDPLTAQTRINDPRRDPPPAARAGGMTDRAGALAHVPWQIVVVGVVQAGFIFARNIGQKRRGLHDIEDADIPHPGLPPGRD
jgi:hypothetical protein